MALRSTSYGGSSSSLTSFVKGIANQAAAYKDSNMAYQYSSGQLTPEKYLEYITSRMKTMNQKTTTFITWSKKYDEVQKNMTDDQASMRYQSGQDTPAEYAKYLKDRVLTRYQEGTPDYQNIALKIDQLNTAQQKSDHSDFRMQKLYEISQLGDDNGSKLRSKMDMYQQIMSDAQQDGDEGAYYRAATALNNTQVTYQNFLQAAGTKAQVSEKKALNAEVSAAERQFDIGIANKTSDVTDLGDKYLQTILKAVNSGVMDESALTSLQYKMNDMGYAGAQDDNGMIGLGQFVGTALTKTDSKRLKAYQAAQPFSQLSPEQQQMFGGNSRFGAGEALYGDSLKQAVSDVSSGKVNPSSLVGRDIKVWNGVTGQYEIHTINAADMASGVFDPQNVFINMQDGTAYAVQSSPLDIGGVSMGNSKKIIMGFNAMGKPISFKLDANGNPTADESGFDPNQILAESPYSKDLSQVGTGLIAEKQAADKKAAEEALAAAQKAEQDRINAETNQKNSDAAALANRPAPMVAPVAPPAASATNFFDMRQNLQVPAIPFTSTSPLETKFPGFVAPTTAVGMGNIEQVAPGYQRIKKSDGGFDFVKQGFGNISVDDLAREAKVDKNALLNPNYKF